MNDGPIVAERIVAVSPQALFAFLADLENHWSLADRFVEVSTLERSPGDGPANGGTVRMKGPLGLKRTARTRVVEAQPPTAMTGTASVGAHTQALVKWTLAPVAAGTRVRLEASVLRAGRLDALLLAAGGRRWLQRRFGRILETLARRVGPADDAPALSRPQGAGSRRG